MDELRKALKAKMEALFLEMDGDGAEFLRLIDSVIDEVVTDENELPLLD